MARAYNHNISPKANDRLSRRAQAVRFQKALIAVCIIILISLIILLGSSISAFATSKNPRQPLYKYYTSIQVEPGDTLWDIADTYIEGQDINKTSYIEEICLLNHLQNGQIHAGEYLTVIYYSTDLKE